MRLRGQLFSTHAMLFAMGLILLTATSCNVSSPKKQTLERTENAPSGGAKHSGPELIGASYCVETMALKPPGPPTPIHFSYKVNESDGSSKDFEADLSGDTFDRTIHTRQPATDLDRELASSPGGSPTTIHDGFAETLLSHHYTRDNKSSLAEGWGAMEQGATPWSLFILKPTATPAGFENISGFETLKYVVDTTHQSQLEKSPGTMGWGLKDYNIIGSAWVTKDAGCILQYSIDLDKVGKDGKLSKTHYEGGVTKQ